MSQPIKGSVKQKRDHICLFVVPVIYDKEIHGPFIRTNGVSLAKMERIMPSNCAYMNTHSKSSIVLETTIKEGMKSLQLSTISNHLHKTERIHI